MGTFHSYVSLPESSFQNSTIQGDCSISTSCRRLKSSFLNGFKSLLQQKFPRVRGFLEAQNLNIQMGWCKNWDSIRILPTRTSTWWQLYTIMNYNDLNFHGLHVINIISSKKIWQFIQRSTFLFCSYIVHVINRSQIWQWPSPRRGQRPRSWATATGSGSPPGRTYGDGGCQPLVSDDF